MKRHARLHRRARVAVAIGFTALLAGSIPGAVDAQESYQRISGEGSSWAANAIDAMRVNVKQFGITVDYNPSGSSAGRKNFLNGTVDFAASDIPFQFEPEDGSAPENPAPGSYAYIPVTAGGTAFMYNLNINGQRVTNLRLSGENVSKIFTGVIKQWNDPAIAADNPGLTMPARAIVPVVRSDGSGSTAQFTKWMIARHPQIWDTFCQSVGRSQCGFTSQYPTPPGGIAQSGDVGVAGYVSQGFAEGAIGYVNYSYALGVQFPVAKVLNAAGYYTEPTPENVAVGLLQAKINTNEADPATYLTQDLSGVYTNNDPRNYELSSYSYFILPTTVGGQFTEAKGRTLARFTYYAMCEAQQQSASLGYSPLPVNLVTESLTQIAKIPGAEVESVNVQSCNNPTFSADGTNVLARDAPKPQECDKQGPSQCATGTGGLQAVETPAAPAAAGGGGAGGGGAAAPGAAGGGGTSGAGATTGATTGGATTGGAATGGATTDGTATGGATTDGTGAVTGTEVCDPDTGICGVTAQATGGGAQAAAGQPGAVTPTTLDQDSGWGSKQTLMVIVVLFTLGLVFIPAYAWRKMTATPAPLVAAPASQAVAQDRVSV
jgi:phosphate ABC transporter phosphate-binding protein